MKYLGILAGRLAGAASRLTGRGATSLPGVVAEKIDPQIAAKLSRDLAGIIVVTGTNGKTTTSRFIANVLREDGQTVIHNQAGSNLMRGIVSTLLKPHKKNAWGLFEVDEATMPEACRQLQPACIVVTNLFRDQLDRYGELRTSASHIAAGIAAAPGATLVLNSDDPLVATLAPKSAIKKTFYFGIDDASVGHRTLPHAADSVTSPSGELLEYQRVFVGHLGHYHAKDLHRPMPRIRATHIQQHGLRGCDVTAVIDTKSIDISLPLPGLYNVYNALAALAAAKALECDVRVAAQALTTTAAAFGRTEVVDVGNRKIFIGLIKNPTGANELLHTLATEPGKKHVLVAINDNFADGKDVSWLWDADFELLLPQLEHLSISGRRALNMALRMKYAGLPEQSIETEPHLEAALQSALEATPAGETLYVLPTYTAMLDLRRILSKQRHITHFLSE